MKKKSHIVFSIIFFGITFLIVILTCCYYFRVKNDQISKVTFIFNQSVEIEKKLMGPRFVSFSQKKNKKLQDSVVIETSRGKISYKDQSNKDSLTFYNRDDWKTQLYLSFKNPNRAYTLDSIFQISLKEENVIAKTAVLFFKGDSLISCSNKELYRKEYALESIVFGDEDSKMHIKLQVYVLFPFSYIVSRMPLLWGLCVVWCISVICLWIFFRIWTRKKVEDISVNKVQDDIVLHTGKSFQWKRLPLDFLLCEETGELKNKDNSIFLKKNRLRIFIKLLNAPGFFLNYEELSQEILHRSLEENVADTIDKVCYQAIKKALTENIKRLRNDLDPFKEISIENVRNSGYQLKFETVLPEAFR